MDSQKRKRKYTSADKANLDKFCDSDRIGVTVNLSQEINTILWGYINKDGDWDSAMKAYYDNCLLSILATIEIDSAKKEYPLDCNEEIQIVRARYDERDEEGRAIKPNFFAHVAKKKGYYDAKKKNYKKQLAPMDFVQDIVNFKKRNAVYNSVKKNGGLRSIGEILGANNSMQSARIGYVDLVIAMIRIANNKMRLVYQSNENVLSKSEKRKVASQYFDRCVKGIQNMNLNTATMRELLIAMDRPENSDIKRKLWVILFSALGKEFFALLAENRKTVQTIEECAVGEDGDTKVFWLNFRHVNVK